jgi:5,10-methylenetetrahydromethanopterin reductase
VVSIYNDLLFQPALGPLLWMAPHVHRAQRIGPAALNPYLTHPLELAGQAALLDLATNGRAYLGLARGAWLRRIGVHQARPLQTLREAILLIRHLLGKNRAAFEGSIFHHPADALLAYSLVRVDIPITVGTWGTRTARLAGELADEIKIGGSANPRMARMLKTVIAGAAQSANRAPESVGLCLGAVTVVDTDRQIARELARQHVQPYLSVVGALDPTVDSLENDARLDCFTFAGTPDDIVRHVEDVFAAGATRVEFGTPLGQDPFQALRLLGERVLPAFVNA